MAHILVDSKKAAALSEYIEKRKADITTLQTCLDNDRFKDVSKISHNIKVTAAAFGFSDLIMIAFKMEEAARFEEYPSLR